MHSTVTNSNLSSLLSVSHSENNKIMRTIHPHLTRPKIYYGAGFGWSTDYLHGQNIKKKTTTIKN